MTDKYLGKIGMEIAPALMAEISWTAANMGARVAYLPLGKEITTLAGDSILPKQYTRVTFYFTYRTGAEDFTRFLASKGLVFQVDFYYDLRRSVSFIT